MQRFNEKDYKMQTRNAIGRSTYNKAVFAARTYQSRWNARNFRPRAHTTEDALLSSSRVQSNSKQALKVRRTYITHCKSNSVLYKHKLQPCRGLMRRITRCKHRIPLEGLLTTELFFAAHTHQSHWNAREFRPRARTTH